MIVAQYLADTLEMKVSVTAIAQLLDCEYRITKDIIAVFINDSESLKIIKQSHPSPSVIVE